VDEHVEIPPMRPVTAGDVRQKRADSSFSTLGKIALGLGASALGLVARYVFHLPLATAAIGAAALAACILAADVVIRFRRRRGAGRGHQAN